MQARRRDDAGQDLPRLVAVAAFGVLLAGCATWPAGRRGRTIRFSGEQWSVRASAGEPLAPGPNVFSDSAENVRVDSEGRLHLRIVRDGPRWNCAEIVSRREFGRGTYRFFVATPPRSLAPGPVLGLFTYNDSPVSEHREVDVELSSAAPDGTDAQFVVQPGADDGTFRRFRLPADAEAAVYSFRVLPGRVEFAGGTESESGAFEAWTSSAAPDGGAANVRMNLWLARGAPPAGASPVEAVVSRFEFVPSN